MYVDCNITAVMEQAIKPYLKKKIPFSLRPTLICY